MPLYFGFGSNLSSSRLRGRVGEIEVLGVATLHDYRHRFNKHGTDGTAKGNIELTANARVIGVLYRITAVQLVTLDKIEGGYERELVDVEPRDAADPVTATTYVAVDLTDVLQPTAAYIEHYRRGVEEHGIDLAYLNALLAECH